MMTALVPVPTLGEDGWTQANDKVTDYLLCHFFEAEWSQSYIYTGRISSLPYLLYTYNNDPDGLAREVKKTLLAYFSRYFNDVMVEALDTTSPDTPSQAAISLYMSYRDVEGVEINLSRMIQTSNMRIHSVIDLSNSI